MNKVSITDEIYMRRCIQLAKNGRKNAQPNPMVGAVIVHNGKIIGEGYHVRCGEGHAEVNACASVNKEDEHLLKESTIYVSLEPCSHYGKTPPCADLLVSKGFKRCVIGCKDPFAKVQGRGIQKLKDAGIEVTVGVLEEECKALNKRFMTFHALQRPFVTLKWAE
ncbi:MAG: bifunctional diaminohydroxyphosphoribosylaminopyrimidine deaminase/5-amino-6-(5-phosphoribosylamino)uracil reductase RibD, partial [Methanobrevibacter sp.]|nr:bifunctional diaminohydroxyphosphoribosylaminopyrimidine deaminase/5-amino-6-(5-phosphoribosylamino)uracil reductase RibD [Methanobrevibacter sp.]